MKRLLKILWLVIVPLNFYAQTAVVVDRQTGKPLPNVLVFDADRSLSVVTNPQGAFDLGLFKGKDLLVFRHSAYYTQHVSYNDIVTSGYKVFMDERLLHLNEGVVSEKKWEENEEEIPNELTLVDQKEIILENPATTADMLISSGEVFVQKSQLGGGSPMLRGFAANKILFIVDGVRMNNAIYRSGNLQNILQADVNSLESAEVIFGPGTNIYGSDALGGVIDFHLKRPVLNINSRWRSTGNVLLRFSTAAKEKTAHVDINVANNRWGFLTMVTFTDFDDLRMGSHGNDFYLRKQYITRILGQDTIVDNPNPLIQRFSGYTQKVSFNLNNHSELNANFYLSGTSQVPRYDRLIQTSKGKLKYAEWYYKPQQWAMFSVGYSDHGKTVLSDGLKLKVAYQKIEEGRNDRKYRKMWRRERKETVHVVSLNLDVDKKINHDQQFYYGAELVYNYVRSDAKSYQIKTGETKPAPTRYPDGGTDVWNGGVYFTYKKNFGNNHWTGLGGLRGSFSYLNAVFVDTSWYHFPFTNITLKNGALTGNAGLVYHTESNKISLNVSSGFRAPNLDDVAKVFDSEPGIVVVPNEHLKPEYLYNLDVSYEKKACEWLDFSITAFYSHLVNAMIRGDYTLNGKDSIWYDGELSKVEAVVNAGYANIWGANATAEVELFTFLSWNVKANYIKGVDNNDHPLRHVSPFFGETAFDLEYDKLKLELSAFFNGSVPYDRLAPSERKKTHLYAKDANGNPYSPAWWTLNLKGSYAFNENFLLTFGVENLLDQRYRPYSSGITAPGINGMLALRISF
jgi:hemoglobin/transferrin/lactoferrin receptor protein